MVTASLEKKSNGTAHGVNIGREVYESKAVLEAMKRTGKSKNLHGVVHEVLAKDLHNSNPVNLIKGHKMVMTKSANAKMVDSMVMKNGKILERIQYKDTVKSVSKTVKQVASGKYRSAQLVGTKETAKKYNEIADSLGLKHMKSSGISSNTTRHMASKGLGQVTKSSLQATVKTAARANVVGAAIGAGFEAVSSFKDVKSGEITKGQYVAKVGKEGVKTYVSGYASTVAAPVATAVATTAIGTVSVITAPAWVPIAVGGAAAVAVGFGVKKLLDKIF